MKHHTLVLVSVLLVATALMAACGSESQPLPTKPEPTAGDLIRGEAVVEEIDILILESFPVQINVVARGYLPDGCTEIDDILQKRTGMGFEVTITTVRPSGAICDQATKPFEEVISLDVAGLKAGRYTVVVNGITGTFDLAVDNVLPSDSTP